MTGEITASFDDPGEFAVVPAGNGYAAAYDADLIAPLDLNTPWLEWADGRAEMACFATRAEADAWIEKNRPFPGRPRQPSLFGGDDAAGERP